MSEQLDFAEQDQATVAVPPPLAECLAEGADASMLRDRLTHDVDYALSHYGGRPEPGTNRHVVDRDKWRTADRAELARAIAVHLVAGIDPVLREQVIALMDPLIKTIRESGYLPRAASACSCGGASGQS